jgi:uncharacterized protein (TIGR02594 family)
MPKNYVVPFALTVRKVPGLQFKVTGFLRKNEVVEVLEYQIVSGMVWKKIQNSKGLVGWCPAKYLAKEDLPIVNPPPIGKYRTTATLTVREAARTSSRALYTLKPHEVVEVKGNSPDGKWKSVETAYGLKGWCAIQYLVSLGGEEFPQEPEECPWMPIALAELGVREIPGAKHTPRIIEYMMSTTLPNANKLPDETDWCACFVSWCMVQAGVEGIHSALVNPWLNWGEPLAEPRRGCVAIFNWGHIGFYIGESGPYVRSIGGNQSQAVWISSYDRTKVLAYRMPAG